jgi:tryptophan-rich sensory protein
MRAAADNSNRRYVSLGFFLLLCFTAAAAGGLATYPNTGNWYASLLKPEWTPPHSVFAPIWSVLYGTMAVSAWLVWDRRRGEAFPALKLFAYQLGLNVLWSILFFGLRNPDAAAAEILVLWLLVTATAVAFHRVRRVAGWLMAPYWSWISFAAALNFSIAGRN